ncbi:MAG: flagellar basal body P-ring formation protein FlgA [Alphaproteobacteria bacterium]|nr:flagellar basal body P-ring formation protein FlgA [Alphaproteobacteria bacterium]
MNPIQRTARCAAFALTLALTPLALAPLEPAMATEMPLLLKSQVVVDGGGMHLSDLFANLPAEQDSRLADSPAPGERMILGARTLWQYAQAFKLNWRPRSNKITVAVIRDSRPVPREVVESAIATELARAHVHDDFDISLFDRDLKLYIAAESSTDVRVSELRYDPRNHRFEARVLTADSDKPAIINGKIEPMVDMPVLRRHGMPGHLITAEDIEWRRVPGRMAAMGTVSRIEDLVGYLPRRPIPAGQTIRVTDLKPDIVVYRRNLVTVLLKTKMMSITTRGEALRDGARGDVIQVRNSHSRKVIEARVVGPDTVEVLPSQTAALAD